MEDRKLNFLYWLLFGLMVLVGLVRLFNSNSNRINSNFDWMNRRISELEKSVLSEKKSPPEGIK
jgi:hypothetical protein